MTKRDPLGMYLTEEMILKSTKGYYRYEPKKVFMSLLVLAYSGRLADKKLRDALRAKPLWLKVMITAVWPLGGIVKMIKKKNMEIEDVC